MCEAWIEHDGLVKQLVAQRCEALRLAASLQEVVVRQARTIDQLLALLSHPEAPDATHADESGHGKDDVKDEDSGAAVVVSVHTVSGQTRAPHVIRQVFDLVAAQTTIPLLLHNANSKPGSDTSSDTSSDVREVRWLVLQSGQRVLWEELMPDIERVLPPTTASVVVILKRLPEATDHITPTEHVPCLGGRTCVTIPVDMETGRVRERCLGDAIKAITATFTDLP